MPDSPNLKEDLPNFQVESLQQSNTATKDLPPPNIPTMDTPPLSMNTKPHGRTKKESQTHPQENSTPISASSTNSEQEELDPLTPKQEKLRLKYQGMYTGLGGLSFGFSPYTGMVLMQGAAARSEELIRWARHNPFLYKWLERFADSSDTVNFIAGHGLMLWAIIVNTGRLKGNSVLFSMAGLTKEQVMAPPPGMPQMTQEEMNAYTAAYTAANGHRGT